MGVGLRVRGPADEERGFGPDGHTTVPKTVAVDRYFSVLVLVVVLFY